MDDDSYARQPIDWNKWRGDYKPPHVCNCAEYMKHNLYWLNTEGRPGIGWDCPAHGVMKSGPDGLSCFISQRPLPSKPAKSVGTRKYEVRKRLEERRAVQASLFGNDAA